MDVWLKQMLLHLIYEFFLVNLHNHISSGLSQCVNLFYLMCANVLLHYKLLNTHTHTTLFTHWCLTENDRKTNEEFVFFLVFLPSVTLAIYYHIKNR